MLLLTLNIAFHFAKYIVYDFNSLLSLSCEILTGVLFALSFLSFSIHLTPSLFLLTLTLLFFFLSPYNYHLSCVERLLYLHNFNSMAKGRHFRKSAAREREEKKRRRGGRKVEEEKQQQEEEEGDQGEKEDEMEVKKGTRKR